MKRAPAKDSLKRLRLPAWWPQRRWVMPAVALAVLTFIIVGASMVHAVTQRHVQLDDGSVWVTSLKDGKAARFNVKLKQATATVTSTSSQFDVAQYDDAAVLDQGSEAASIDPSSVSMASKTASNASISTIVNGGTAAMLNAKSGNVWTGDAGDVESIAPTTSDPALQLGDGGLVAVDHNGDVYGFKPADGTVWKIPAGSSNATQVAQLGDGGNLEADSFTVVDGVPVVSQNLNLIWPNGSAAVEATAAAASNPDAAKLTLQSAPVDGAQSGWVAAASQSGLVTVPLGSGKQTVRTFVSGGSGAPATPASTGGCVFGAWSQEANNELRVCGADAEPSANAEDDFLTLDEVSPTSQLAFRANHRLIVLNDVSNGNIWNPNDSTDVIKIQWHTVDSDTTSETSETDDSANTAHQFAQECSAQSGEIKAVDDSFGVRAGERATLDVLRNDEQTDCSVLSISSVGAVKGASATVAAAYDGRYLQFDASSVRSGTVTFSYEISDGRGQTSSANVTVAISDDGNRAPKQTDIAEQVDVEQGATVTVNALGTFTDPDGDPLTLTGATIENTDQAVATTRADGKLTVNAGSMTSGTIRVKLSVSDGQETASGMLYVTVREAGTLAPTVDAATKKTAPDTAATLDLADVVHGNSATPVSLTSVDSPTGATATMNAADMSITLTAADPGTYYVPYTVAQGTNSTTGLARFEVAAVSKDSSKPVAVNDVALLQADGTAIIEPLANDIDPLGGVLSVTKVDAGAAGGLKAGLVANKRIYITATQLPSKPVTITYTVANAVGTSTGSIVLQPPAASAVTRAPEAGNVTATVRCGGIVSVDVLDHVTYADGTTVSVSNDLETGESFAGLAFVSGDNVRYQAPQEAGEYKATYTVTDNLGNAASGTITFSVHERDAEHKAAPKPKSVEAQVGAGQAISIPITLTGIDADGDDVQLLGLGKSAPQLGRIVEVGANYLTYEAYADASGTDEFTYAVEDWTGQKAEATVKVGVFADASAAGVYARDDSVTLRPGTEATVPVALNDISADDSDLTVDETLETQGLDGAKVSGNMVEFTTPDSAGVFYVNYTVRNEAGLKDTATLTVTVDPDAPIEAPTAYDIPVPASATIDRRTVNVDVSSYIANPSGSLSDLEVSVDPSATDHASVVSGSSHGSGSSGSGVSGNRGQKSGSSNGSGSSGSGVSGNRGQKSGSSGGSGSSSGGSTTIAVELTDEARAVPYTVTNTKYGISTTAFIEVPAYGVFPPTLRPKAPALTVNAGETIEIDIADYVRVGAGKSAVIRADDGVSATKASNSDFIKDDTTLRFTAISDYSGPASITFEAADGEADDVSGSGVAVTKSGARVNTAWLTLQITVIGKEAPAPTFSSTTVDVVAGEAATSVDLTALTHSAAGAVQQYSYSGGVNSGNVNATVSAGGTLTLSASEQASPGTSVNVPVTVSYSSGSGTKALETGITARVVASNRPLARLQSRTLDIKAGESQTIDVTDGAYNPFPDAQLTVVSARSNNGALSVSGFGTSVTVKAGENIGAATYAVTVTVQDATRSESRQVSATLTFNVSDRPAAPLLSPIAGEPEDGAVNLSWTPGATNGSPISEYQVEWDGGSKSCGAATSCRITGLKNGTTYTFVVRAKNAVGWSEASNSVSGMPDVAPSAPAAVTVAGGYLSATVKWAAPSYEGTAPDSYKIVLSGPNGWTSEQSVKGGVTSAKFDIPNAVLSDSGGFVATVSAHNAVGSGPSTASAAASAWGNPEAPSVTIAQSSTDPRLITGTVTVGNTHGAGCASITLSRGSVSCSGGSFSFELGSDELFREISVSATMQAAKPGVAAVVGTSKPITAGYTIETPSLKTSVDGDRTCVVEWSIGGEADGVQLDFGSASGYKAGKSGSERVTLEPWTSCPEASAAGVLNGHTGASTSSKADHTYKAPPQVDRSRFSVTWDADDRGTVVVKDSGVVTDSYQQSVTYTLTIDGKTYAQSAWANNGGKIEIGENVSDNARWTLEVSIEDQKATLPTQRISGSRAPVATPDPTPSQTPSESAPDSDSSSSSDS